MKMTRLQSCPPHPMVRLPHADHGGHPLVPHEAIVQSFQKIIASSSHLNPHRAKKSGGDLDLCGRKVVEYLDGDPEDWSMIWTANTTASIRILMDHYEFGGAPLIGIDIRSHTSAAVPSKQIAQKGCGQVFYFSTLGSIPVGGLLGDEVQRVDHQGGPIVNSLLDYLPGGHFTDALSWPRHPLLMIPSVSNYDGCHCDVSAIQRFVSAWKCEGVDWRVCIDAAKSFGDGSLRLSNLMEVADYVVFSMFKLCGLSNGVGCLLVRRAPLSLFPLIQDSSGPHHYPCYGGGGVVQWSPTTDHVIPTPELPLRMSTGTPPYLSILHNIDMMETWGKWNAGGRMNRNANTLAKLLISNLPLGLILLNGHREPQLLLTPPPPQPAITAPSKGRPCSSASITLATTGLPTDRNSPSRALREGSYGGPDLAVTMVATTLWLTASRFSVLSFLKDAIERIRAVNLLILRYLSL
eukprot:GHVH01006601.1.p1 GENE.GHVH01006601.1~~GHVH01006601.1.p1  ORF type:complete len:464 (+),score=57.48 GHVH01006601.1:38-1429(+)